MKREKNINKILDFLTLLYRKLFRINDTPQRIALGFGLGIFLGILPTTGPLASLFLASVLRINRASALIGSLLTNTWLSIATFLLSIKLGSAIMQLDYGQAYSQWRDFLDQGNWLALFKLSIFRLIFPVVLGYCIVGLCLGFLAYLLTLVIIIAIKHEKDKSRANLSR